MGLRLSVLIPVSDATAHVAASVERVRRAGGGEIDIVLLCDPSLPDELLARLQAAWPPPGVRCVVSTGTSPGAVRNAGVSAASGDLVMFLEAGDSVDPRYLAAALRLLESQPSLDFATAWARRPGAAGLATPAKPVLTLDAVLADRHAIPAPTVFRVSAWEAAGRFDERLPSREWHEFWIRVLAAGSRGEVIEEELIDHQPSRQSAYRRRLDVEPDRAGIRALLEKHRPLFQQHVVTALCDREAALKEVYAHYYELLRRRDSCVAEQTVLREEMNLALQDLSAMGAADVDWGDLRHVLPLSPNWGYERGTPIDRYYIERFLDSHADDVHGAVLEVQEPDYTRRFGGSRVSSSDVIDVDAANTRATITGDLRRLEGIPSASYDCFILTQTIHVIDDMRAVLRQALRILKPGGVLLVTLPCASRVCLEYGRDGDFWRVTEAGARQLFADLVPASHLRLQSFGNVLTNVAFLEGLACHEISAEEFEVHDPFHPLLVGVRAVKPGGAPHVVWARGPQGAAAVLLYHRVAEPPLDVHGLCVPPGEFRAQMEHLAQAYRPMPLAQLARAAAEGWLPERAVAVTFDDGYLDNLEHASPILLELGIPATFFLTSEGLLGTAEFWWDVLAAVFFSGAPIPERLEIRWREETLSLATATAEERHEAHWALYHRIRTAVPEDRNDVTQRLKRWAGIAALEGASRPMGPAELQALARRAGHSIGGHGSHHLSYSAHSAEVVRKDLRENRMLLEETIGRLVSSFAYPFGDHDDGVVRLVGAGGYRAAVTCVPDLVRPGTDPLRLPRSEVKAGEAFEERLRRLFAASPAHQAPTQPSATGRGAPDADRSGQ